VASAKVTCAVGACLQPGSHVGNARCALGTERAWVVKGM